MLRITNYTMYIARCSSTESVKWCADEAVIIGTRRPPAWHCDGPLAFLGCFIQQQQQTTCTPRTTSSCYERVQTDSID